MSNVASLLRQFDKAETPASFQIIKPIHFDVA